MSEGEVANTEDWDEDLPVLLGAELTPDEEFESLFEEAAKGALSLKAPRKKGGEKRESRPPSGWMDSRPQWVKAGFTLRVVRQECNCGSVHSVVEGIYRNDSGRREGES